MTIPQYNNKRQAFKFNLISSFCEVLTRIAIQLYRVPFKTGENFDILGSERPSENENGHRMPQMAASTNLRTARISFLFVVNSRGEVLCYDSLERPVDVCSFNDTLDIRCVSFLHFINILPF